MISIVFKQEPDPAEVAVVEEAEEEALTVEGLVPVIAVEEGGEVEARMEAAAEAGVAVAEGVSTGEHSK